MQALSSVTSIDLEEEKDKPSPVKRAPKLKVVKEKVKLDEQFLELQQKWPPSLVKPLMVNSLFILFY